MKLFLKKNNQEYYYPMFLKILLTCCSLFLTVKGEICTSGQTKQHKTLCNQYYECIKDNFSNSLNWTLKICEEGLVYNEQFNLCVLPDDDWDCPNQKNVTTIDFIEIQDTDNFINLNENKDEHQNFEYRKWFKFIPVRNVDDKERYGKSKSMVNSRLEDTYESSGFGNIESYEEKNNNKVINNQILLLNQLMTNAKQKSSDKSVLSKKSETTDEQNDSQRKPDTPNISSDVLKVLMEFSKDLIKKPEPQTRPKITQSYERPTVLQPIVRPIYINVPVQNRYQPYLQGSYYNPYPQIPQNYPYPNISQLPLVDSYGYPIASHLGTHSNPYYQENQQKLSYYPYQLQQPSYNQEQETPETENYDTDVYYDGSVETSSSSEESEKFQKFAYLGDTLFPYDQYKNSILPYLKKKQPSIEVFTCSSTARQPNKTDCTKYFVCNPQTGVHPFSCPFNTAFNEDTRYCDIKTYKECMKIRRRQEYISQNRRRPQDTIKLQNDVLRTMEELKKLRKETLELQRIQSSQLDAQQQENSYFMDGMMNNYEPDSLQLAPSKPPPMIMMPTPKPYKRRKPSKPKKRLTCLQPGKVADPDSLDHYYVCFKTPENTLKLHKMKCPSSFVFCKKTMLCAVSGSC